MRLRRGTGLACLLIAGVLVSACAKNPEGTPIAVPTGPRSISLTVDLDHKTAHAPTGDLVRVTLPGTTWSFGPPTGTALVTVGDPVVRPGANCGHVEVGAGCGTVTATYHATAPGHSTITASRTTCGEARRCVGDESSSASRCSSATADARVVALPALCSVVVHGTRRGPTARHQRPGPRRHRPGGRRGLGRGRGPAATSSRRPALRRRVRLVRLPPPGGPLTSGWMSSPSRSTPSSTAGASAGSSTTPASAPAWRSSALAACTARARPAGADLDLVPCRARWSGCL